MGEFRNQPTKLATADLRQTGILHVLFRRVSDNSYISAPEFSSADTDWSRAA